MAPVLWCMARFRSLTVAALMPPDGFGAIGKLVSCAKIREASESQRGEFKRVRDSNRFSGLRARNETVEIETVSPYLAFQVTPLKRGVNENRAARLRFLTSVAWLILAALFLSPAILFAKEPAPPAPAELLLREIRYDATLSDHEARFVADIDVELSGRTEASLPLFDGDVAVLTTKLPPGLRIVREGNRYSIVASRTGRTKARLDLVARITRAEPWNQISFVGPVAAIASINAQASGAGVELQLLAGTLQQSEQKDGATRVRGFLGPERTVSLRWQSKAAEAARKAVVTCETIASAQIAPSVIKFTTELRYTIAQGSVAKLTVALPNGQALTKLNGAQIRDWQVKIADSGVVAAIPGGAAATPASPPAPGTGATTLPQQLLTVEFIKPVEKSYALTLFSEQTVDATPFSAQLQPPQPLEIARESGGLTIAAEDVTVETESTTGLRQINSPAGALAAYQFYGRPFALGLKLRRIEPVIHVATRVTARLEEARLLTTHAVSLNVEKAGIYAVELSPLGSFVVADVRGEGIEDWKARDGKLFVNFASRVLGARKFEVHLERALKPRVVAAVPGGERSPAPGTGATTSPTSETDATTSAAPGTGATPAFPEQVEVAPLHVAGAVKETAQIGAASTPGIRLKTAELIGLREIPVTQLSPRADESLAFAADQADWTLKLACERLSSRIVADVFNLVTIGDGLVGGSAAIRYAIINQGVQEFRVTIPGHCKNVEFTGPNIRRKEEKDGVWAISLQDNAWGAYTLVVTYDYQFDPHKATLPVGGIHALDVERETGSVAVTCAANLDLNVAVAKEPLRRIDEFELAESARALITRPVLLAYRYEYVRPGGVVAPVPGREGTDDPSSTRPEPPGTAATTPADYQLALDVTRFAEAAVLDAVADRTQLTTVLTDAGQMLTQASFMVKNNDKQFQKFTMPPGTDFWSCHVAGQPVKPEKDGDSLLVPLPRGANRDQTFAVEIVYAQKIGSLKTIHPRTLALAAPVTDMQTTFADWELFVPETHQLTSFAGNMTVARGTTYGLRDGWRRFVAFYEDVFDQSGILWMIVGAGVLVCAALVWAIRAKQIVAFGAVVALVVVLAAMLLPTFNAAREQSRRSSSLNNLQQIGLAMRLYSGDNNEKFPGSLEELVGSYVGSHRQFIDPETGRRVEYVGQGRSEGEMRPDEVLAYSPLADGANVLYADGHVAFVSGFTPPGDRGGASSATSLAQTEKIREAQGRTMAWNRSSPAAIHAPPGPLTSKLATEKKLNSIVLPKVKFDGAKIEDVINFFATESRRLDPEGNGVNIGLRLSKVPPVPGTPTTPAYPPITLNLRDIPLYDVLKLTTDLAGMKFRIERDSVAVVPLSTPEEGIVTRVYPIQPGAFKTPVEIPEGTVGEVSRLGAGVKQAEREDVKKFFVEAGVPFPAGADASYDEKRGLLTIKNTPENFELFDRVTAQLQVATNVFPAKGTSYAYGGQRLSPPGEGDSIATGDLINGAVAAGNIVTPARFISPMLAGIRPIRIEIPRTGQRFSFTKVLNVDKKPLTVRALAMERQVFQAVRGGLQAAMFLAGVALVWLQLRRKKPSSFLVTVGVVLVLVADAWLLISMRWLHVFLIAAAPVLLIALLAWLVWKFWPKKAPANGTVTNGGPSTGPAAPPAVATIALLLFAASVVAEGDDRGGVVAAVPGSSRSDIAPGTGATTTPTGVSILSANYTGAVRERVAEFEATIDLNVARAGETVPLFNEEVAVQEFSSSPRGATLVREGKSVSVKLPRRGKVALKMKFLVKLAGDVTKRQIGFGIPAALASKVTLTIDEPEAAVEFPTAVSFRTVAGVVAPVHGRPSAPNQPPGTAATTLLQRTRLEAVIGSGERIEVNWTPRVKRAADTAATVFCQSASLVKIGSGIVQIDSKLDYQVTQGELRHARVALPKDLRLVTVQGDSIRTWEVKEENGEQVLAVELIKGVTASNYTLKVVTERALEKLPATLTLLTPRALDVKRETGLVALSASEELGLLVERADELQRVDAEEFARASAMQPKSVVSAYRFQKPGFALGVRAEAVQAQIEAVVRNRFHIHSDSTRIDAQVEYTIKRAGVFSLRLEIPAGYAVTGVSGDKVAQWNEKEAPGPRREEGGSARTLEVQLKERVQGPYCLRVFLLKWQKELPKNMEVAGVHPLGAQKLSGFVSVTSEAGVQAKAEAAEGLTEVPADATTGSGALAYKFLATDAETQPKWKLVVATEALEPWVRAEVANWATLSETLLSGRAVVRYDIANAPVKELRLRVPAAFKNVEINGANIRRRDQKGEEWAVQLQSKVFGSYALTVTWEQPFDAKNGALDLPGIETLGTERETGSVAIAARPPWQVEKKSASSDLLPMDVRELPAWAGEGRPSETVSHVVLAWRYLRPGYKLSLAAKRFEEAQVLQALVDNVRLTTVVAEDGQMMTLMTLSIRNNARQHLEVELPAKAEVWSAFVAGRAVRPTVRDDGKLLLPLERTGADDAPVSVELTYVVPDRFRGRMSMKTPSLDVPLKNARWDLYLPADYRYSRFEGTMAHEAAATPHYVTFTASDYERADRDNKMNVEREITTAISNVRSKLAGGKLKEAAVMMNNLRQIGDRTYAGNAAEVQKLQKDIAVVGSYGLLTNTYETAYKTWVSPSDAPQAAFQFSETAQKAAEQQWDKLQQAQELAEAKVQPLRVNLPTHGVRHSFTQVLQTEMGKPMTIEFSAVSTRTTGWPMRIGLSVGGFVALWLVVNALLQQRTSRSAIPS